jgi:hypothetical protein
MASPAGLLSLTVKIPLTALSDESKANLLDDFAKNKTSLNPAYVERAER